MRWRRTAATRGPRTPPPPTGPRYLLGHDDVPRPGPDRPADGGRRSGDLARLLELPAGHTSLEVQRVDDRAAVDVRCAHDADTRRPAQAPGRGGGGMAEPVLRRRRRQALLVRR